MYISHLIIDYVEYNTHIQFFFMILTGLVVYLLVIFLFKK